MATVPQRETSTLEDIHGALVAERSKKAYASGIRQVVKWIQQTNQADALLSADGSINLAAFSYDDFVRFIVWTMQNTAVKASTMSGYRSAMRNYYKMQKVPLPSQFDGDLKDVFQGIRRITATSEQTTSVKDSGKRTLGYGAYDALRRTTILAMDAGFLHLFLVLSWNLMARSKSTETIQLGHLSYEEDAVGITFFKSKIDQDGSKRRDPRHIYANPLQPHTCAFLALGLYLDCNPMLAAGALFPGSSQRTRFGKGLKLALMEDNLVGSSEIGTHSIRKGAATFVSSGSTGGPSLVSI
ncbi:hypothetical protein DYB38_008516 [Aphanomyces astaci]|uniref:Core-binding (CB) domain-containing protein n=1 Tax=Aphanomyces astaci TaxID=112090 RepID=A0A397D278_APHAT|nr:hypothetical protein DYB38_008516 [Aphanomyces astaci]